MFEEPFAQGSSLIHGLDPRIRLIMALIFAVVVAFLQSLVLAGLALGLGLTIFLFSNPPVQEAGQRLLIVNSFILFLWIMVPWSVPGEAQMVVGPLIFSKPGLQLVWLITLKSNALFFAFLALVATMDTATIGYALGRLKLPSKLVFLFLFTYRYIHVLTLEWQRLLIAARLRGFVPRTNLHSYRTWGNLLAMVFIHSYDRSTRVYTAMLLRGFQGQFVSLRQFQARAADYLLLALWSLIMVIMFVMEFWGDWGHV